MDIVKRPIMTEKSMFSFYRVVYVCRFIKVAQRRYYQSDKRFVLCDRDRCAHHASGRKTRKSGKRAKPVTRVDWKKALVRLQKGQRISIFDVSEQSGNNYGSEKIKIIAINTPEKFRTRYVRSYISASPRRQAKAFLSRD